MNKTRKVQSMYLLTLGMLFSQIKEVIDWLTESKNDFNKKNAKHQNKQRNWGNIVFTLSIFTDCILPATVRGRLCHLPNQPSALANLRHIVIFKQRRERAGHAYS